LLRLHGTLEKILAGGRFAQQADDLRLYRRIATMDAAAPLPALADQTPRWADAAALAREWELNRLADRLDALAAATPAAR
jgi:DNA polymerase-1